MLFRATFETPFDCKRAPFGGAGFAQPENRMSRLETRELTIRFGGHVAVNAVTCTATFPSRAPLGFSYSRRVIQTYDPAPNCKMPAEAWCNLGCRATTSAPCWPLVGMILVQLLQGVRFFSRSARVSAQSSWQLELPPNPGDDAKTAHRMRVSKFIDRHGLD